MKILLIDPPFQKFMGFSKYYIPLGLLYLAAELKKRSHEVLVYDADYNPQGKSLDFLDKMEHYSLYIEGLVDVNNTVWSEVQKVIEIFKPDVVGISLISTKFISGMKIAEIAKRLGVKKVICGGVHTSICPDEVLGNKNVDSIVVGEGEEVFEDALTNRKVVGNRIKNLDDISFPLRENLYNLSDYKPSDLGMIISSRGCPYSCSFCCSEALWGRKVIFRSVDNITKEIVSVKDLYGTTDFYFADDSFTCNKQRTLEFCSKVKNLGVTWSCLTRADLIDEQIVMAMKESGCRMVKMGLESGSQKVLGIMNKRTKKEDVIKASDTLRRHNLNWTAYFMVGTPGENEQDVDETLDFIREVVPTYISFSIFTPYPGTPLYEKMGLKNILYHLYNHHSNLNKFSEVSSQKIKEVAMFSDNYNRRVYAVSS
uniref:Putative radical SAM superfamily protein n=1 Tax=viral metagenome TaxID=1070528 RepID=A0A6M3IP92_9ZZZZ